MKAFEVRILDPIKQERNYFNFSKLYPFICSGPFDLISCRSNYCFLCVVLRCVQDALADRTWPGSCLPFLRQALCSLHSLCPCSAGPSCDLPYCHLLLLSWILPHIRSLVISFPSTEHSSDLECFPSLGPYCPPPLGMLLYSMEKKTSIYVCWLLYRQLVRALAVVFPGRAVCQSVCISRTASLLLCLLSTRLSSQC